MVLKPQGTGTVNDRPRVSIVKMKEPPGCVRMNGLPNRLEAENFKIIGLGRIHDSAAITNDGIRKYSLEQHEINLLRSPTLLTRWKPLDAVKLLRLPVKPTKHLVLGSYLQLIIRCLSLAIFHQ
jgi:hypothetical protein